MKCKYIFPTNKFCVNESINNKNFCKSHMYYENKVNLHDLKWCDIHNFNLMIFDDDKQYYCKFCKSIKDKNKILCEGLTNEGNTCKYKPLQNDNYCEQHQNYKKWKILSDNGKKICINWIRGCWSELNDEFSRCLECRKKERIKDKNLREIKKDCALESTPITLKLDTEMKEKNIEKKVKNKEYFQKYYQEKKKIELENIKIPDDILILPKNFSIFVDTNIQYIQFQKSIQGTRIAVKNKILSNDIQAEINTLIDEKVKIKYPDIINQDNNVINAKLFKSLNMKEEVSKEIICVPKPTLPNNFSITTILGKDKIQFSKTINGNKIQEQKTIKSYNLQNEINNFVTFLNEKYELNIPNQTIRNPNNWKTTNKILEKEENKGPSRQTKYLEKKKAELGEEAFKALKAKEAKERREKKKQENKNIEV